MIRLYRDTDIGGSLSGGPTDPIPQEVREKIEAYASWQPYSDRYANAAEFGYSLSLPTIQAQEERIRVLEEALRTIRDGGYTGAYMIAHEALTKALAGKKEGEV